MKSITSEKTLKKPLNPAAAPNLICNHLRMFPDISYVALPGHIIF